MDQDQGPDTEVGGAVGLPDDEAVAEYLGHAHSAVRGFAELLVAEGVTRGLIGPREAPRLWERHLLNSAAVAQFLPEEGTVVDVGSGAGLPGIVLAAMRPDLDTVLLEPMERRVRWLTEVIDRLELPRARVLRGRAEDLHGDLVADAVTARAVAPMDRLAGWTLPLLRPGGVLLAMKGDRAADELAAAAEVIERLGGGPGEVLEAQTIEGASRTLVVRVVRVTAPAVVTAGRVRRGSAPKQGTARGKGRSSRRR